MARFKLTIEYQGTRYSGWQIQANARTIQGEILDTIRKVTGHAAVEFQGAGRTDAGVHALAQVAHLEIPPSLPPEILRIRINDELPADISILSFEPAPHRFHARHNAVARSYLSQIARRRTAFGKRLVWWVRKPLNLERMRQAASLFPGMRDCRSFSADDPAEKSTRVLIDRIDLSEAGDLVLLRIEGSHFLWRMVRRVVGVIAAVGTGEVSLADVQRFLEVQSPEPARLAAPASGLFLERVYYPGDGRLQGIEPVLRVGSP